MAQPPQSGNGDDAEDPLSQMFSQLFGGADLPPGFDPSALSGALPTDPEQLSAMMSQVQRMMSSSGDEPVNWELAKDTARQVAAAEADPVPSDVQGRTVRDLLTLAESWLQDSTAFVGETTVLQAWSRAEWVEATIPVWQQLAGPVAVAVADAMAEAMTSQVPPEMRAFAANASGFLRQAGGGVFGSQVGHAVGSLASDVMTTYDIGVPLTEDGDLAILPHNVAEFAKDLEIPEHDVLLYLTLREAAHHRLYSSVAWLRSLVFETVEAFARGIRIDTDKIEQAVSQVNPENPEELQEALNGGLLQPDQSPEQEAALERLELLLALIEGWVDHLVHSVTAERMPSAQALRETMRRRRAAGGPAESTLASLVGLQLRPRRLRDAAALWACLEQAEGTAGRDAVWSHPDLLPTLADLDDPVAGAERLRTLAQDQTSLDLDAELRSLLAGETPPAAEVGRSGSAADDAGGSSDGGDDPDDAAGDSGSSGGGSPSS